MNDLKLTLTLFKFKRYCKILSRLLTKSMRRLILLYPDTYTAFDVVE